MTVGGSSLRRAGVQPRAPANWGFWGIRYSAIVYLSVIILLPLSAVFFEGFRHGIGPFWRSLSEPIALSALRLTLLFALITTLVNSVMGTMTAYVLVRFHFPGRKLFNAFVDLPFAIPTLVTGVMLVVLYGPQGLLGEWLENRGLAVVFAKPGILLALLLVTYPFVVRAVQPVLGGLRRDHEEAAWTIGASRVRTFFSVVLPEILPAIATGALLTFARALGEFGSVVVVAGNIAGRTLTAPVHVYAQIESENRLAASSMSVLLLALSFSLILTVDLLQKRKGTPHAAR